MQKVYADFRLNPSLKYTKNEGKLKSFQDIEAENLQARPRPCLKETIYDSIDLDAAYQNTNTIYLKSGLYTVLIAAH